MIRFDPRGSVLRQVKALGVFQMGPSRGVLVYRFYDAASQLLYVGVSATPSVRWQSHKNYSPWWPEVAHVSTHRYDHKAMAHRAETAAINTEYPVYNVQRKRRDSRSESGASRV